MALVKMAEEFGGLPMESLIGGPLQAACDAQTMLAGATARFIEEVGLVKEGDKQVVRTVGFSFTRSANGDDGNGPASEKRGNEYPAFGDGQSSVSVDRSGRYYLRYGSKIFGNSVGNRR